jgi:membrane protease YdiL (CAAX protease family)
LDYHIDKSGLFTFILFGTILRTNVFTSNIYYADFAFWFIAIGLAIALKRRKINLKSHTSGSLLIVYGMATGIGLSILFSIPSILGSNLGDFSNTPSQPWTLFLAYFIDLIYQLGHASILEEPVFRGFLWGYLYKVGWEEKWIWLFQAGLFWLAHLDYILSSPYSFLIVLPMVGLVLGRQVWRTHSITISMFTHASYNSMRFITVRLFVYLSHLLNIESANRELVFMIGLHRTRKVDILGAIHPCWSPPAKPVGKSERNG